MTPTVGQLLGTIERRFGLTGIGLKMGCPLAEKDHRKDARVFAHTWHYPDGTICMARDIQTLEPQFKLGILLHEVGHLLAGPYGSEKAADDAIYARSGISIMYKDISEHIRNVQCVPLAEWVMLARTVQS